MKALLFTPIFYSIACLFDAGAISKVSLIISALVLLSVLLVLAEFWNRPPMQGVGTVKAKHDGYYPLHSPVYVEGVEQFICVPDRLEISLVGNRTLYFNVSPQVYAQVSIGERVVIGAKIGRYLGIIFAKEVLLNKMRVEI